MFSRCKRENVGDESDEESLHKNPMENTNVEDDAGHCELSCKAGRRQVVRSGQSREVWSDREVWSESCGLVRVVRSAVKLQRSTVKLRRSTIKLRRSTIKLRRSPVKLRRSTDERQRRRTYKQSNFSPRRRLSTTSSAKNNDDNSATKTTMTMQMFPMVETAKLHTVSRRNRVVMQVAVLLLLRCRGLRCRVVRSVVLD